MSTTIAQHHVDYSGLLAHAVREIEKQYSASVSAFPFARTLHKFGRNEAVGTSETTIMTLPGTELHETYANIAAATNAITHLSSSAAGDGEDLTITGHTVSSGVLTRVTQTITMAGQTKTALTTPLARVERAFNASNTELTGTIYIYEDDTVVSGVPQTDTKVRLMIPAGGQQSRKAGLSTADGEFLVITTYPASLIERAANTFANVILDVRETDGVWRLRSEIVAGSGDSNQRHFSPYFIVKPNSDVRLTAVASGSGTDVAGEIDGFFLTTIS